jgi:histidinol-phosphate aminotransferase
MAIRTGRADERTGPRPVPWLKTAAPAVHGSFDASAAAELGIPAADILDFSANGNIIGPPPGVAAAIAGIDPSRYPDRGARELRAALSTCHGVPPVQIVLGNGSTEIIWAIARAFLGPGDSTLVAGPTYGEYAAAAAACGARVQTCDVIRPDGALDVDALGQALQQCDASVVWLCHPNNPTGSSLSVEIVRHLIGEHPATLFVVDEAYLTLCPDVPSTVPLISNGNVVVVRSMTKDYALAGLRIGYGLAAEPVTDALSRMLPPWSLSSVAQVAALIALADADHLARAQQAVADSRIHLMAGLAALDYQPRPSLTNFVLVPVGDGGSLSRALLERGFAVRNCASFGLPDCIRIGVRRIPDQERLLAALNEIRGG